MSDTPVHFSYEYPTARIYKRRLDRVKRVMEFQTHSANAATHNQRILFSHAEVKRSAVPDPPPSPSHPDASTDSTSHSGERETGGGGGEGQHDGTPDAKAPAEDKKEKTNAAEAPPTTGSSG